MKRLLFDMSSVLWASLLAGKDKEFGHSAPHPEEGKPPVWINSADYGFENFINSVVATLNRFDAAPRDVVMVFDGASSKAMRQGIFPGYKANRSHHPESYIEFDKLKQKAESTLLGLGATSVWQDGYEADDVLAHLAQNLAGKKIVVSNDGDTLVLHNESTDVYCNGDLNENKYGPFPFRHITLYKALVGDSSDNIKGAHKFGPKSFIDVFCDFGEAGLDIMVDLIKTRKLERLEEDVPTLKCLQRIIDSKDSVYLSWELARLYPERINTGRKPLQIKAGMVQQWNSKQCDARLKQWYGASRIVHATNYEEAKRWALGHLLAGDFVALDIETSTPAESDEWLEAKKRGQAGEDGAKLGVDVLASQLTGMGLTFGKNQQYSLYFTVDHVETDAVKNLASAQVRQFLELIPDSKPIVVQNASFELSVLYQEWGEAWKDNGYDGFLPNIDDTKLMKSYVDENSSLGLKQMSKSVLGYEQTSYDEVTQGRKMNQMTAEETVDYGLDDTICTAALYTYLRFVMELENTWEVYREVEIGPAYLNALRFVQGTPISLEKMRELAEIDTKDYDAAWALLRDFLIKQGWEGSVCPKFQALSDFTPNKIKEAYAIVTGRELETQVRTPAKLFTMIEAAGEELLASLLLSGFEKSEYDQLNKLIATYFRGEPQFNSDSPKQMQRLLYETLGLEVRLRNPPTPAMRQAGVKEGGARTDDLALQFALTYDTDRGPEIMAVLKALQTMKTVATRRKLYYEPYRHVQHWKTGLVHSQLNQCQTVTRRYSEGGPNKQQLPKHPKQGRPARFREVFVGHKRDAVVVSLDFDGQELRNIAEQSRDENMLACFVGEHKKDMHSLTAAGIIVAKAPEDLWRLLGRAPAGDDPEFLACAERWASYSPEAFAAALDDKEHPDAALLKILRALGKKTNFTTEYGAQAPKLAETLIVTREEAQQYIDAKLAAFPRAEAWKKEVVAQAKIDGYTTTMMGARRHLAEMLFSTNKFDVGRAERQGVNYKVQGSCAEQTKLAEARLWKRRLFQRYDARYIGPIHDELVSSVLAQQAVAFIKEKHAAMTENYAGMKVPIVSSISLGINFGEQIEIGAEPDEAKINEALRSLGFAVNMTTA